MTKPRRNFKNLWNLSILITLLLCLTLEPGAAQLEEFSFDSTPFDPFLPNSLNSQYQSNLCHSYVGKDKTETTIYATQVCRNTDISLMYSEIDWISDIPTYKYQVTNSIPSKAQTLYSKDGLFAVLTGKWELIVADVATGSQKYNVTITKPPGLTTWMLNQTNTYFVIFYQTVASSTVSEYFYPIYKSNGTRKWALGVLFTPAFNKNSVYSVDSKLITDYPGDKFFLAWESNLSGAVSIKKTIIGPNSTNAEVEAFVETSYSSYTVNKLNDVGVINGNEYVIYTTLESGSSYIPIILWRKDLDYAPTLVYTGWVRSLQSLPSFVSSYVINGAAGNQLLLVYKSVTSSSTQVMYALFNDDGTGTDKSNTAVMSKSDIEVDGVVIDESKVYFFLGPINDEWFIAYRNFYI